MLGEQIVGALQFFIAQQQPLYAFNQLFDGGGVGHNGLIVGLKKLRARRMFAVGARGVVHMPQFNGKQEGAEAQHTVMVCWRQVF